MVGVVVVDSCCCSVRFGLLYVLLAKLKTQSPASKSSPPSKECFRGVNEVMTVRDGVKRSAMVEGFRVKCLIMIDSFVLSVSGLCLCCSLCRSSF
jgi:hypothetical protein